MTNHDTSATRCNCIECIAARVAYKPPHGGTNYGPYQPDAQRDLLVGALAGTVSLSFVDDLARLFKLKGLRLVPARPSESIEDYHDLSDRYEVAIKQRDKARELARVAVERQVEATERLLKAARERDEAIKSRDYWSDSYNNLTREKLDTDKPTEWESRARQLAHELDELKALNQLSLEDSHESQHVTVDRLVAACTDLELCGWSGYLARVAETRMVMQ